MGLLSAPPNPLAARVCVFKGLQPLDENLASPTLVYNFWPSEIMVKRLLTWRCHYEFLRFPDPQPQYENWGLSAQQFSFHAKVAAESNYLHKDEEEFFHVAAAWEKRVYEKIIKDKSSAKRKNKVNWVISFKFGNIWRVTLKEVFGHF